MLTGNGLNKIFSNKYSYQSGITLIEILVVLAVMGIVCSIAYPNFDRVIDNYRLRSDALQLAQEMRSARVEAVVSQQARDIRFYPSSNSYKIAPSNRVIKLSTGIRIVDTTFPNDPLLYVERCRFKASGAPSNGGHIWLTNQQGKAKYVIVNPVMGRVRVADTPPADGN